MDAFHGPLQEFCLAMRLSCDVRHDATRSDDVAMSDWIAACVDACAALGALTGPKTNARSFHDPSPLMSPPTSGVKRIPDARFVTAVSVKPPNCFPVWRMKRCRGVKASGVHSARRGSPAVV